MTASIFQGWLEFDDHGRRYRAENCGSGVVALYELRGSAFVRVATLQCKFNLAEIRGTL